MAGDWLKLHRKIEDSAVMSESVLCHVWVSCLVKASYHPSWFAGVAIPVGSFAVGIESWAEKLKMSRARLRRALKKLELLGNITVKSTNKFTIISVCNWQTYNGVDSEVGQQAANKRPTSGQQAATSKECKEDKECKEQYRCDEKQDERTRTPALSQQHLDAVPRCYRVPAVLEVLTRWAEFFHSQNGKPISPMVLQAKLKEFYDRRRLPENLAESIRVSLANGWKKIVDHLDKPQQMNGKKWHPPIEGVPF